MQKVINYDFVFHEVAWQTADRRNAACGIGRNVSAVGDFFNPYAGHFNSADEHNRTCRPHNQLRNADVGNRYESHKIQTFAAGKRRNDYQGRRT